MSPQLASPEWHARDAVLARHARHGAKEVPPWDRSVINNERVTDGALVLHSQQDSIHKIVDVDVIQEPLATIEQPHRPLFDALEWNNAPLGRAGAVDCGWPQNCSRKVILTLGMEYLLLGVKLGIAIRVAAMPARARFGNLARGRQAIHGDA